MADQQDGLHSSVQISYSTFENYYALQPGYTFDGRLSFGLDVGKTVDLVNSLNSTVLRPNVSYLLVKQEKDRYPVSIDLNVAYQFNYVSQVVFNARAVQFGAGIYHEISPFENVKIIPSAFFNGSKITAGPTRRLEGLVYSYGAQTSIMWENKYYLTPKISFQEGINTITIKMGMILSSSIDYSE
ncbi:MAG: hypothetical protein P1U56_12545 [Saprospiraceae bacterium]|nr:hypothetical protein [Saprospiraceae bacterium]